MSHSTGLITPETFWFLRHGETDWNTKSLAQGDVEVPLNETGLTQARAAAQVLKNRGIATIISSPLGRARVTAGIVAEQLGLPVEIDEGLREVSYGDHEGEPMSQWFTDWIEGRFTPKGGESFEHLTERAVSVINRALTRPATVMVVGHGGLFRGARAAMGLEPNFRTPNGTPYLCEPGTPWTLTGV